MGLQLLKFQAALTSYRMALSLSFCTPSASQFRERLVAPHKPAFSLDAAPKRLTMTSR
jgi:hypothetical protein